MKRQPSIAVIDAVARSEGVDATGLPPMYESVDTEALDALFDGSSELAGGVFGEVCFEYAGYVVTVRSDGSVGLRPAPAAGD